MLPQDIAMAWLLIGIVTIAAVFIVLWLNMKD